MLDFATASLKKFFRGAVICNIIMTPIPTQENRDAFSTHLNFEAVQCVGANCHSQIWLND